MVKKLLALFLVVLISIESFAAAVSDNDGSAFITKAEFDSLKNDFQSQLDQYNTSIDNKIDTAIASYLAGVKVDREVVGSNYIHDIGDVRFYSTSKDLNTSTLSNIYTKWLVRAFGAIMDETMAWTNIYTTQNRWWGTWFYTTDGRHVRDGSFNTTGSITNYFYQVSMIDLNGSSYPFLSDDTSKSITHTYGAYGAGRKTQTTYSDDTAKVAFAPYNLDLRGYSSNFIEPWTFSRTFAGITVNAAGSQFNIYNSTDNSADKLWNYRYFSNVTNKSDSNVLTYTENDFNNWTVEDVYTHSSRSGGDWWGVGHFGGSTAAISEWTYRRTYVGPGYGTAANNWITYESWYTKDSGLVTFDTTPGKIYYMRPDFKQYASGDFVNGAATKILKKLVYPTDGVPLTKIIDNTKKMDVKLNIITKNNSTDAVATGKSYYILITDVPFDNVDTTSIISGPDYNNLAKIHITDGSSDVKLSFDESSQLANWSPDDILYLRVYPEDTDYYALVDCSEVLFTIE